MTRKCIMCRENNYKNAASFFSAPKDAETRKLWQDAIDIEGYDVTDDTYICSKHFDKDDVITHWVSGIPPNVIKIEYKKCRLRQGAVPKPLITTSLPLDAKPRYYSRKNVCSAMVDNNVPKLLENNVQNQLQPKRKHMEILKENVDVKKLKYNETSQAYNFIDPLIETEIIFVDEVYNIEQNDESGKQNTLDLSQICNDTLSYFPNDKILNCDLMKPNKLNILKTPNISKIYDDDSDVKGDLTTEDSSEISDSSNNQNVYPKHKNIKYESFENDPLHNKHYKSDNHKKLVASELSGQEYDESDDYKECDKLYNHNDSRNVETKFYENVKDDSLKERENMLFEDFLDIYSEVVLPQGWSSLVIKNGHATMVVYSCMNVTSSGVPYTEKQVFVHSDMHIRCAIMKKEVDPFMYNLAGSNEKLTVRSLMDIEDLIEIFSHSSMCTGCPKKEYLNRKLVEVFMDGEVVHHINCSLLVNHGMSICSKCHSLKEPSKKMSHLDEALIHLKTVPNTEIESEHFSKSEIQSVLINAINHLQLLPMQKLVLKECLKKRQTDSSKYTYSRTWVFVSLVLYTESPRTYKYLLRNKYLTLPSVRIMKRYMHRIKVNSNFYSLFRRSIEPFQLTDSDDIEQEPT